MCISLCLVILTGIIVFADTTNTTINTSKKWAWSSSVGWIDCRADPTNGVAVSQYICSGYMYSPTVGWVCMGNGTPTNGIRYSTNSSSEYGVNNDGQGNLSGYAWSPSVGWISFQWTNAADPQAPKFNVTNGIFSGYAYGAGAGWLSLSGLSTWVKTDRISPGTTNSNTNGIPDAWVIESFGTTNGFTASGDSDTDGVSNLDEYLGGTNPTNKNDFLSLNDVAFSNGNIRMAWRSSRQTRLYRIEKKTNLLDSAWIDSGSGTIVANSSTNTFSPPLPANTQGFFRIRVSVPQVQ